MNTLVTPILNYPTPNLAAMDASRAVVNGQVASLKLDFLPALKEKLPSLQKAMTTADTLFKRELSNIVAVLRTVQLEPLELKRQQVEADTRLSKEQRQQALALLAKQQGRIVADLSQAIGNGARAMAQSTDDLVQIDIRLQDSRLRTTLQGQVDSLSRHGAELQVKLSAIAEDRRLLDETIKTFEKFNLLDVFKEQLPTQAELSALSLPAPELALAQAGIARLQKMLENLSRSLTYQDLVSERDKLRARYNEVLAQSREGEGEVRRVTAQLDELTGLASADQSKSAWADEARNAFQALRSFHDSYLSHVSPQVTPQLVEQLVRYIASFYSIERDV